MWRGLSTKQYWDLEYIREIIYFCFPPCQHHQSPVSSNLTFSLSGVWTGVVVCSPASETALKISNSVKYLFRVLDKGEFGVSYGNHMFGHHRGHALRWLFQRHRFCLVLPSTPGLAGGQDDCLSLLSIISTFPIASSDIRFTLPVSILPSSSRSFSAPLFQHSASIRSFNEVDSRERLFCQILPGKYRSKEVFCLKKAKLGLISAYSRATEYQLAGKAPAGLKAET